LRSEACCTTGVTFTRSPRIYPSDSDIYYFPSYNINTHTHTAATRQTQVCPHVIILPKYVPEHYYYYKVKSGRAGRRVQHDPCVYESIPG